MLRLKMKVRFESSQVFVFLSRLHEGKQKGFLYDDVVQRWEIRLFTYDSSCKRRMLAMTPSRRRRRERALIIHKWLLITLIEEGNGKYEN